MATATRNLNIENVQENHKPHPQHCHFNEIMFNPSVDTSARAAQNNGVCLYPRFVAEQFGPTFRDPPKITWPKMALPGAKGVQGMALAGTEGFVGLEFV